MASASVLQEPESPMNDFRPSEEDETLLQPATTSSRSERKDGIDPVDDDISASPQGSRKTEQSGTFSQKFKRMFKGKSKIVSQKENGEPVSQEFEAKSDWDIIQDGSTSKEKVSNVLDSGDGDNNHTREVVNSRQVEGLSTGEMNRDHRKVVVKIKSNTRIVNIPLEQNNGWLDTLKMAVVKTFQDVLAHGEKETEFSLEKVADAFLFQVYDPEFEEFVDLTDETVLPRKARLKLQPIAKSYGNADRTAWSSKEMNYSQPVCINVCHLHCNTQQQCCTVQNGLAGNFKIRAIATDVTRSLFVVSDNRKVVAVPERHTSVNVVLTKTPQRGHTPKYNIKFSSDNLMMAINNTTHVVEAVDPGNSGYTYDFDIVRMIDSGFEMYWSISKWVSNDQQPKNYLKVNNDGQTVICIDYGRFLEEWAREPGLIFAFYAVKT